jgi:hypothetical protein
VSLGQHVIAVTDGRCRQSVRLRHENENRFQL